ncbi:MAG TPA: AMP-binding protein, partial [Thermomicrobiales bacterium]
MLLEQGLRRSARLWPDKIAAIDGDHHITYGRLAERVNRLANGLIGLGLAPGDRVGVLMLNAFRYLELYYAVNVVGGIIVPLNYRLAVPELVFMLNDCSVRMLVIGREYGDIAEQIEAQCPSLTALIFAEDEGAPSRMVAYEALVASASPVHPSVMVGESDVAGIFYTGGTTGRPKGVMLSHRNLVDNAYRTIISLAYTADDTYLHAAPMFHLADSASTFAITWIGATHAHVRTFDPTAVLETIARDRVTRTVIVPTMIAVLINHPAIASSDLSSLRSIGYGASPIAETTLQRAIEVFGCQFRQAYGMTEAAPILTILAAEDHRSDRS